MLHKNTLEFLIKLSENNNKPWFDENRKAYETAKADFEVFISGLIETLSPVIPEVKGVKAKDCIFRIFRDVRFSKNKEPYKSNFGAAFGKDGKKISAAGYYLHIEPGNKSFIGGGLWMPEGEKLKAVRQEIDYNYDSLKKILEHKEFKKYFGKIEGESLKKAPQGYTEDNPAIDLLKMKSFTVGALITDRELAGKDLNTKIAERVKIMKPFIDFLNSAIQ